MKRLLAVSALFCVAVIPHVGRAQDTFRCQKIAAGADAGVGTPAPYEDVCTIALEAGRHTVSLNWSVGAYGVVGVSIDGSEGTVYSLDCYANGLIDWGCHTESAVPSSYQHAGSPLAGAPVGTGQVLADFVLSDDATLTFRFASIIRTQVCPSEPNCVFLDQAAGIFTLDGL
jgi:hypothetical protein